MFAEIVPTFISEERERERAKIGSISGVGNTILAVVETF
jgi:hypothetical protein